MMDCDCKKQQQQKKQQQTPVAPGYAKQTAAGGPGHYFESHWYK